MAGTAQPSATCRAGAQWLDIGQSKDSRRAAARKNPLMPPQRVASACTTSRARGSSRKARKSAGSRSEEHTSELQSPCNLVCRLLLEKKKQIIDHRQERGPRYDALVGLVDQPVLR